MENTWGDLMNPRTIAKMWQDGLFPNKTLTEICIDLRQSLNGSADPWGPDEIKKTCNLLNAIVQTWDDNSCNELEKEFDDAILSIVKTSIKMISYYQ